MTNMEPRSLAIGGLAGIGAMALAGPAVTLALQHVPLASLAASTGLVAAAGWIRWGGLAAPASEARAIRPGSPPSASPAEWLAKAGVVPGTGAEAARAMITEALMRRLVSGEIKDGRVRALFNGLLATAEQRCTDGSVLAAVARAVERSAGEANPSGIADPGRSTAMVANWTYGLMRRHGTTASLLLGALAQAREVGVVAPAEMLWLKGVDRDLWYAVSSLGRSEFPVEGMAAMAHYRTELAHGNRYETPQVEPAVGPLMREARALGLVTGGADA